MISWLAEIILATSAYYEHNTPVKYFHLLAQEINNWTYFHVLDILKFTLTNVGAHFSTYVIVP
jgi:hypothetical protein